MTIEERGKDREWDRLREREREREKRRQGVGKSHILPFNVRRPFLFHAALNDSKQYFILGGLIPRKCVDCKMPSS